MPSGRLRLPESARHDKVGGELYKASGLPRAIGAANIAVAPALNALTANRKDQGWVSTAPALTARPASLRSTAIERRASTAPSSMASERDRVSGSQQVMQWLDSELELNGLSGAGPSIERMRIFSSAFGEVIDSLPTYRPFLQTLRKEYDGLVQRLQLEVNAMVPMEGRLKTMRAESLSFVGESMTWYQMEIGKLRRRVEVLEAENKQLKKTKVKLEEGISLHKDNAEKDRYLASESHLQNLDILKHLERLEKQVEALRTQEKDLHTENKFLEGRAKERDNRILTVEEQLKEERQKLRRMVPKEDLENLKEDMRHLEARYQELEENYEAKHKDYINIVEAYSKKTGQKLTKGAELRPLTPRPTWSHCFGLVDPTLDHTVDKAAVAQDVASGMLTNCRTLLCAYGLAAAAGNSPTFQAHAKHASALPLEGSKSQVAAAREARLGADGGRRRARGKKKTEEVEEEFEDEEEKPDLWTRLIEEKPEDILLPPDVDAKTPAKLRHKEEIRDLCFSRKKTADFMESLMHMRLHRGMGVNTGFLDFMFFHLEDEMSVEEAHEFAVNIFSSVRRFSAEPDFLAYSLLIQGKIPDSVVRDNKHLCSELLTIFSTNFETGDGTTNITKQKFFYGLREVLQNKEQKMWQDLVTYFPAGGPDVLVNFEWVLLDDLYVLSPIVFALRLQHLEEVLNCLQKLESLVIGAKDSTSNVKYEALLAALSQDEVFNRIDEEDYAKAFNVPRADLEPALATTVARFLDAIRQGDFLRTVFFPTLPPDEPEQAQQGDVN